jgi:putative cardiolipin synthase
MFYICSIFIFSFLFPPVVQAADPVGFQMKQYSRAYKDEMPGLIETPDISAASLSGFHILETGDESLSARLALINSAEKTLDLQYYAVNDDITSNLLILAIIRAANRGVKVRFLIDDISLDKPRRNLLILNAIDNIQVRIFNPITTVNQTFIARMIAFFADMPRTTQRMHNKALIADNRSAIVGGRNLGDEYFDAHSDMAFKDIDVLSDGPVTHKITANFEKFWNDRDNTYPITDLHSDRISPDSIKDLRTRLEKNRDKQGKDSKADFDITYDDYLAESSLVEAPADFIADTPRKLDEEETQPEILRVYDLIDKAQKSILIVSPYFVPGDEGMSWLEDLKLRGVKIRVITNSLASTDVVAVHTGYDTYRKDILGQGVELFELKPVNGTRTKQRPLGRKAPSYASLHAKIYVVDEKVAIVGSLNFDPRSTKLNTEVAMVIYNEQIARELVKLYGEIAKPKFSYKVRLKNNDLEWVTTEKDREKIYHHEPRASIWRRLQATLINLLPVEDQL